ncbi:hypothetical protein AB0A74_03000 [Saccharothrix sp. NPDC042600]
MIHTFTYLTGNLAIELAELVDASRGGGECDASSARHPESVSM